MNQDQEKQEVAWRRAFPDTKKIHKVVDIGTDPSLGDCINFLLINEDINFSDERYEFPITKQQPLSVDDLVLLGQVDFVEVSLLSIHENGEWKTRLTTGNHNSVTTDSLFPVESYFSPIGGKQGEIRASIRVPEGYPIVNDSGEFTGQMWDIDFHNHPQYEPYPSPSDLLNTPYRSKVSALTTKKTITFFGKPPEKTSLPNDDILKQRLSNLSAKGILSDRGKIIEISKFAQRKGMLEPTKDYQTPLALNKIICMVLKVPLLILDWEKDKEEIEKIIEMINNRTFELTTYLESRKINNNENKFS